MKHFLTSAAPPGCLMLMPAVAGAQTSGFHSAHSSAVTSDPGVLTPPVSGAGTRLMWLPAKSAVRAGTVTGLQWNADSIGTWTTAFGYNTVAKGIYSTAFGNASRADGQSSFAVGQSCVASGDYSLATGRETVASGFASTAMGNFATASGSISLALGSSATAAGSNGIAIGSNSDAAGLHSIGIGTTADALAISATAVGHAASANADYSSAYGYNSNAIGYGSTALGGGYAANTYSVALGNNAGAHGTYSTATPYAQALGNYSVALGQQSTARGTNSIAAGSFLNARAYGSVALGFYNDSIASSSPTVSNLSDPLLYVGNGTSAAAPNNALLILKTGNVGINTSNISARLHVRTVSGLTYPQLLLEDSATNFVRLSFKSGGSSTNVWTVAAYPASTNSTALMNFYWQGFGDVLQLKGDGNATLAGSLTQNSDRRLKKNSQPIEGALEGVRQLGGYRYNWVSEKASRETQIGVIAQEVQTVYPELVTENDKGVLSVNYSGLVPVLINALKEQQLLIERLQAESQASKLRLVTLTAEVEGLKRGMHREATAKQ